MTIERACHQIERDFVEEAQSDFVGLWLIAKWVRESVPSLDREASRHMTLEIIRKALVDGRVVPGEFVATQFVPWSVAPGEALSRIDRAWSELGREPDLGDIVWFVAPS